MKKLDIIFDTDIGADCDDVMALAYLVYAKRNLNIDLKAVLISNGCEYGASAIRAIFEELGEEIPPIGSPARELKAYNGYTKELAERFGTIKEPVSAPNSIKVMREALVNSTDAVICAVGAFTNVAALLESEPDEISDLNGVELVRQKCAQVVLMAGIFDPNNERVEWNIHLDIPATQKVVELCPVDLLFLPSETGINVFTGKPAIEKYGNTNSLVASFLSRKDVREKNCRPSWDPLSAIYAVEGEGAFFEVTGYGKISVTDEGKSTFEKCEGSKHRIIYLRGVGTEQEMTTRKLAADYIDTCALTVYDAKK